MQCHMQNETCITNQVDKLQVRAACLAVRWCSWSRWFIRCRGKVFPNPSQVVFHVIDQSLQFTVLGLNKIFLLLKPD